MEKYQLLSMEKRGIVTNRGSQNTFAYNFLKKLEKIYKNAGFRKVLEFFCTAQTVMEYLNVKQNI